VFLASRGHPEKPVLLRDIATATEAPEPFLSKIFQSLRASGIVRSHRGLRRGYRLGRDPAEISLYDVIVAIAGPAALETSDVAATSAQGALLHVWREVEQLVADRLRATTIRHLVALSRDGTARQERGSRR
jgi:Rrf2 family protein